MLFLSAVILTFTEADRFFQRPGQVPFSLTAILTALRQTRGLKECSILQRIADRWRLLGADITAILMFRSESAGQDTLTRSSDVTSAIIRITKRVL